jgi:hypothetical protein
MFLVAEILKKPLYVADSNGSDLGSEGTRSFSKAAPTEVTNNIDHARKHKASFMPNLYTS